MPRMSIQSRVSKNIQRIRRGRGRPTRGHSPDLPKRRRNRETQPIDLGGRAHRQSLPRGRLGNLQAEL